MTELHAHLLAGALDAPEAEVRRQAVSRLAELSTADAVPLLLRALGDEDWRVRKEATNTARAFAAETPLVDALVGVLGPGDNVGLRNAAVDVLAGAGAAATAAVAAAIAGLDADGRKLAVEVLGRSRDPDALGPLASALDDDDVNVRQAAIEAIAALESSPRERVRVDLLLRCLDDPDPYVRLTALDGLNSLGVAVPWERLERFMSDPTVRPSALSAAALSDSPRAATALAGALVKGRGKVFDQALAALARLAGQDVDLEAVPPSGDPPAAGAAHVAEALRAEGEPVSRRLIELASGERGAAPALRARALVVAALARAPGAVDAAIRALAEQELAPSAQRALLLLGPAALPAIAARLGRASGEASTDPDVRAALIEIAAHGPLASHEAMLPALRAAAGDPDRRVAAGALLALSRVGGEEDLERAAALVLSPEPPIAHAAESCLAGLSKRFPDASRALARRAATHPHSLAATIVLGALGGAGEATLATPGGDVAFLAQAVAADDARTRRAAVAAVAEIGGASAFDVLGFALADEVRDVQLAAARALGRLCAAPARRASGSAPPPRAADVLDLVGRSTDADLVAVTVRAIGDRMASDGPRPIATDAGVEEHVIAALAPLAARGVSAVAIAAVDALGRARPEGALRSAALAGALDHPDPDVVRSAMLKLEGSGEGAAELARCLDHPAPEVRLLAAEMLPHAAGGAARERLAQRAAVEHDRDVRDAIDAALASVSRRSGGAHGP